MGLPSFFLLGRWPPPLAVGLPCNRSSSNTFSSPVALWLNPSFPVGVFCPRLSSNLNTSPQVSRYRSSERAFFPVSVCEEVSSPPHIPRLPSHFSTPLLSWRRFLCARPPLPRSFFHDGLPPRLTWFRYLTRKINRRPPPSITFELRFFVAGTPPATSPFSLLPPFWTRTIPAVKIPPAYWPASLLSAPKFLPLGVFLFSNQFC